MRDAREAQDGSTGIVDQIEAERDMIREVQRKAKLEVLAELVRRLVSPYGGSYEEVIDELRSELERQEQNDK